MYQISREGQSYAETYHRVALGSMTLITGICDNALRNGGPLPQYAKQTCGRNKPSQACDPGTLRKE
jgi:hypothetical protein